MAEESVTNPNLRTRLRDYLKEAPFFCKIIELVLCVISTGLIIHPFSKIEQEDMNHVGIFHVSVCGYILINAILIVSHLLGERLPKKTGLAFSAMGSILCCTAGLILIRDWNNFPSNLISQYFEEYSDQIVSSGCFAVLAGLTGSIIFNRGNRLVCIPQVLIYRSICTLDRIFIRRIITGICFMLFLV
ncbi:hypothetical protein KM043_016948 [Ampulex compressa]|nr:hypothetical protein KM043_016948 [Ampulex compressa]